MTMLMVTTYVMDDKDQFEGRGSVVSYFWKKKRNTRDSETSISEISSSKT